MYILHVKYLSVDMPFLQITVGIIHATGRL